MQGGKYAAKAILATIQGKPRKPFHYVDKGSLATIGRHAAVGEIGKLHLSGFLAWVAWSLIHVFFLINFRSRVLVMLEWGWLYLFHDRGSRLITGPVGDLMEQHGHSEPGSPRGDTPVPAAHRAGSSPSPPAATPRSIPCDPRARRRALATSFEATR